MGIVCEYLGGRHRGHDFFLNEAHFLFFCLSSPPMNEKISGNRTHRKSLRFWWIYRQHRYTASDCWPIACREQRKWKDKNRYYIIQLVFSSDSLCLGDLSSYCSSGLDFIELKSSRQRYWIRKNIQISGAAISINLMKWKLWLIR